MKSFLKQERLNDSLNRLELSRICMENHAGWTCGVSKLYPPPPSPPKIVFLIQGADRLLRPGGTEFFLQNVVYQNFNPPPKKK